jgi:acyl-CoA synthetase (AMP-forming)/AMP-acid ligase II
MLFMDYVGPNSDNTAAVREGDWLSVRDMGYVDAQGYLCLVGRENRMVVTQGKNLFPEEVEAVLLADARIAQASVQGVADPIRGQMVVAVVQLQAGADALTLQDVAALCRTHLEAYKIPKRVWVCETWPQTASGKTDHVALAQALQANALNSDVKGQPCLRPLL